MPVTITPETSHADLMNAARAITLLLPSIETRHLRRAMERGKDDALRAELRILEMRHGDELPAEIWRTVQTA